MIAIRIFFLTDDERSPSAASSQVYGCPCNRPHGDALSFDPADRVHQLLLDAKSLAKVSSILAWQQLRRVDLVLSASSFGERNKQSADSLERFQNEFKKIPQ